MTIRKTPTILIVEDDTENRTAIVKVLENAEYKVRETDNGQQALDIIHISSIPRFSRATSGVLNLVPHLQISLSSS